MTSCKDFLRLKTFVGFAIRSGSVVYGVDNIVKTKNIGVIVYDLSLAQNALDRLNLKLAAIQKIAVENLHLLTSRAGCKAVGIKNKELSKAIINTQNDKE